MAYDWRPTANRAATTDPSVPAVGRHRPDVPRGPAPPEDISVDAAIDEFLEAAESGVAHNRSDRPYRPSALRDLRGILKQHVAPKLGHMLLRDVRRRHIQAVLDQLAAERLSESRIRSVISAVRALYGYAIEQGYVEFSPADTLEIPSGEEAGVTEHTTPWNWSDQVDAPPAEGPAPWEQAAPPPPPPPEGPPAPPTRRAQPQPQRNDYKPIALLPERILSLVLRIVIVLFILFALVTIAESI
jgi:hypothetical protein